jgi:hypothetical protein
MQSELSETRINKNVLSDLILKVNELNNSISMLLPQNLETKNQINTSPQKSHSFNPQLETLEHKIDILLLELVNHEKQQEKQCQRDNKEIIEIFYELMPKLQYNILGQTRDMLRQLSTEIQQGQQLIFDEILSKKDKLDKIVQGQFIFLHLLLMNNTAIYNEFYQKYINTDNDPRHIEERFTSLSNNQQTFSNLISRQRTPIWEYIADKLPGLCDLHMPREINYKNNSLNSFINSNTLQIFYENDCKRDTPGINFLGYTLLSNFLRQYSQSQSAAQKQSKKHVYSSSNSNSLNSNINSNSLDPILKPNPNT